MTYIISIPVKPKPRPRIRVSKNGGRFYPKDYTEWKTELLKHLEEELFKFAPQFPIYEKGKKVSLTIRCLYKDMPKHKSHDADSLAAPILDALTGLGYEDDSQVHRLLVEKDKGNEDKIQIYLGELK
jgi:Holliday junction resolvase RusA-like endonuclease